MKAALFDVFGTLLYFARWQRPLATLLRPLRLSPDEHAALRVEMMTTPLPDLDAVVALFRDRYPERSLPDPRTLAQANGELQQQMASCLPIDGAKAVLRATRAKGWKVGLVTNLSTFYAPLLETQGLLALADEAVLSCEVGLAKPDPAIFHLALSRLQARPEEAVMIGDSFRADVQGARAVGLRGIWIHGTRGDVASIVDVGEHLDGR